MGLVLSLMAGTAQQIQVVIDYPGILERLQILCDSPEAEVFRALWPIIDNFSLVIVEQRCDMESFEDY